jgi:hypothetical protein
MSHKPAKLCRAAGAGYIRDSFYRFKDLYETGGEAALKEISRRKPLPANRVGHEVEQAVAKMAIDTLAYGHLRVSNELKSKVCSFCPAVCAQYG